MDKTNLSEYVKNHVKFKVLFDAQRKSETLSRIEKTFDLLPEEILELFLLRARDLVITVEPDLEIPFGMRTKAEGPSADRHYEITTFNEQLDWPEDLFIGALLRELGHVAAERPPESEWPQSRGDRARFKEHLEYVADATVWSWGLRHYSIRHINATYPAHWAEKIIEEVEKLVKGDETVH
jgi:hypothetical protein